METETNTEVVNPLVTIATVQEIIQHPNADRLVLVSPYADGISYAIIASGTIEIGTKCLWFDAVNEPMVDVSIPEFSFLAKDAKNGYARIRAKKLRGVVSRGLLVPARQEWLDAVDAGSDLVELLNVKKYEAPGHGLGGPGGSFEAGCIGRGPDSALPTSKYDVDSIYKNIRLIPLGVEVVCTEKVHGANGSFGWAAFQGEMQFHVRSRNMWKMREETRTKPHPENEGEEISYTVGGGMWWDVAIKYNLEEKLRSRPGFFLYGELYGQVQDLKYGFDSHEFIAFDCWDSNTRRWLSWKELVEFCNEIGVPHVPVIATMNWNPEVTAHVREDDSTVKLSFKLTEEVIALSNGKTTINNAKHCREGIVIRYDHERGNLYDRVILKLVGNDYLTR